MGNQVYDDVYSHQGQGRLVSRFNQSTYSDTGSNSGLDGHAIFHFDMLS